MDKQPARIALVVLFLLAMFAGAIGGLAVVMNTKGSPSPFGDAVQLTQSSGGIGALGIEKFNRTVQINAQLIVDQLNSTSDIVDFRKSGTSVFKIANAGTFDMPGGIANASGVVSIADNVLIDGQADAVQLTVQGHTTQNAKSFVVENSGGTDKFTVDNSGNVVVVGTSDLQGDLGDSGGSLTIADNLVVTGTSDLQGDVSDSGGDFTIADNAVVTGTLDAQGIVKVGTFARMVAATIVMATDGGVITPLGTYQRLSVSAATDDITPTLAVAGYTAGDTLIVSNVSTPTIHIADSGNVALSTAAALGLADTLTLLFDGTQWVELARSNN